MDWKGRARPRCPSPREMGRRELSWGQECRSGRESDTTWGRGIDRGRGGAVVTGSRRWPGAWGTCWSEADRQGCRFDQSIGGSMGPHHPALSRHPQRMLSKCLRKDENEEMVLPSQPHFLPFLTFWDQHWGAAWAQRSALRCDSTPTPSPYRQRGIDRKPLGREGTPGVRSGGPKPPAPGGPTQDPVSHYGTSSLPHPT